MSQGMTIDFPARDISRLMAEMERSRRLLGKSVRDSIAWAGTYLCKSLGASTRVAKKLRPIVENPDSRWKTDHRRAPLGVMAPTGKGAERKMAFRPIYRTGEYGKVRFFDKKTVSWFQRDAANPKGKWESMPSGPDPANPELVAPGIKTDKRRIIGRRGLARASWTRAAARTRKGGTIFSHGVPEIASLEWRGSQDNPELEVANHLSYITTAIQGGPVAIDNAVERAAQRLAWNINNQVAKKMGAK